ncbi:16S rRNA m(7)G-527 methyltransferase [Fodinibius roseus]|uniref:Ribosomal RNA small subunit methyltransferase G n=1 Tax=Fodinibius roseus TaxID=1194090 RepID=A0A1M5JRL2_9BACT|nr:16S rRNA (guanine(527)-N(7))-methyltransferase RsmG [Fodinibius roseus]SHG43191.1 16S rRNA m(7)G-527 methyltransferase [Fodinibius roseus]
MEHLTLTTSNVSRETFENSRQLYSKHRKTLGNYLDHLLWWNKRINLISRNVSRETVKHHLLHSLLLSQFEAFFSAQVVLDAGSGGGLPGIPLAITHPKKRFTLNDIVSKKCMAMKQMVQRLGLQNVTISDGSVEQIKPDHSFLLISKHAFKINELYAMTSHLPWESMVLYKGMDIKEELQGIKESLSIHRYDLSKGPDFYAGKALVVISRE